MILTRDQSIETGIFGTLFSDDGHEIAQTLEHAYKQTDGSFAPKLSAGIYKCVRGQHRLHNMTSDFITFEITGVKGHTNILFHWGNINSNSAGCLLLGKERNGDMITKSRDMFTTFMGLLDGVDSFILKVS